jgi:hypothetical protein
VGQGDTVTALVWLLRIELVPKVLGQPSEPALLGYVLADANVLSFRAVRAGAHSWTVEAAALHRWSTRDEAERLALESTSAAEELLGAVIHQTWGKPVTLLRGFALGDAKGTATLVLDYLIGKTL